MILALDTSMPDCRLWLIRDDKQSEYEWEAGRGLADGLIKYLRTKLLEAGASWRDIDGIIVYRGPGSFTGLRIGLTVLNTIADDTGTPIVGTTGEQWLNDGLLRLKAGENDQLVMPLYGGEPNITKQRK